MRNKIKYIEYNQGKPSFLHLSSGEKIEAKCINCSHKKCINYNNHEICIDNMPIPANINNNVCPVDAIRSSNNRVIIDNNKCIKCGLCASRCIIGAIYYCNNQFIVNNGTMPIILNEEQLKNINKIGSILIENDEIMNYIYNQIVSGNIDSNLFSRNLMIQCGIQTCLSRKGDINLRMDGIILNKRKPGVCEIEFNNNVLSCPRCILDDLAVMCSRYNYDLNNTIALIVSLCLPNNRTDYWRVIEDISKILNLKIQTITIGFLLITMWNNKKINLLNDAYYCDCNNNSLRDRVNILLNRNVYVIQDDNGIFDTKK